MTILWQKEGQLQDPIRIEDGGWAQIAQLEVEEDIESSTIKPYHNGFFIRFHSYSEVNLRSAKELTKYLELNDKDWPYYDHRDFNQFVGKKLRVTIEEID